MSSTTVAPAAVEAPLPPLKFTAYQKVVIAILAFLQFTIILDFMLLSPLGAILMPALKITSQQFGLVVSAYAFSAAATGFLAAGIADSFDRKKLLLCFYFGFVLGTLFCGLAPTYELLVAARIITGCFGGVIGSIVMAIATDLFPMQMRGRVMGILQTAFASSQILGIPAGLWFANTWGWHAPFIMQVIVSTAVAGIIIVFLRPVDEHLKSGTARTPKQAFEHLFATIKMPRYLQAYAATCLLATGGYMLMPFGSAFSVRNMKIELAQIPTVYLLTGICSIVSGPIVGRLSDAFGKLRTFYVGSLLSLTMVLYYTQLGPTSIAKVVAVSAIMFTGIQARMIASQALMSGIPDPASRGSFMSINSCTAQLAGGIASALAGMIVIAPSDESLPLQRFDVLGFVVVGAVVATLALMWNVGRLVAGPKEAGTV
jgi:predicted MFS family arabinose efflux permease